MVSKVSRQVMLETERIILRKIEPKDAPTLLKWGQDNIYHKRLYLKRTFIQSFLYWELLFSYN